MWPPRLFFLAGTCALMAGAMVAGALDAQPFRETADPYFNPVRVARLEPLQPATGKESPPNNPAPGGGDFLNGAPARPPATSPPETTVPVPPPATTTSVATENPGVHFEPGRILARVGGYPVFVSDLAVEARQLIDQHIADAPESVKQQEFQKLIPRMLPKYVQAKVLYVNAVTTLPEGAKLSEIMETLHKQFDETVLPKLMEQSGVNSPALLDAHYRLFGSSLRRTRETWAEGELVRYTVRTNVNVDPEVSHRELYEQWLAERDEKWSVPARVRWERLSVRFDRFPTRAAAWDAIAAMGNEVVYGASFAAVAKKGSQGYMAEDGGQQGWTNRGSLSDRKLEDLLFSMELNELSDIHESDRGFDIVRVLERSDAGYVPFETAQPKIREALLQDKREAEFQKYVNDIKDRIPVEIFE